MKNVGCEYFIHFQMKLIEIQKGETQILTMGGFITFLEMKLLV